MSVNQQIPDYDLDQMLVVTAPEQLRAVADPLRTTLLELLLERAATITEMARAVDRPKSTVGYHVNFLHDAGLLSRQDKRVVTAINAIADAAAESAAAQAADELRCLLVHARIPIEEVR